MKLTLSTKLGGALVVGLLLYVGLNHFNLLPSALVQRASVPVAVTLSDDVPLDTTTATPATAAVPLPSTVPSTKGVPVRMNVWAWNAQMGLLYANGGPLTTTGSLMERHGVRLTIERVDDTDKSKALQIKFATALAGGAANPAEGIHFLVIMGDGAAQYLAAANKLLAKLGAEFRAEIVAAIGYSRGEDAFEGPEAWKITPASMKGGVVAGVLRDGDWNIAQYFLAQNGIKNNPDERTWDPDALNWVAADDYVKAAQMFVNGYCEDRPIVVNGRKTTNMHRACVQGAVTWTPGDVTMAKRKGGVVKILSTKENVYQMPAVVIGIHKWDMDHPKIVEGLLGAAFEGADQVRGYPDALVRASKASYAVYREESPAYWLKYYKGVVEPDRTGNPIALGGSTVMNLADNRLLFGMAQGAGGVEASLFKATYEGFGNIAAQQYPALVPSFPRTAEAVDLRYLGALSASMPTIPAEVTEFDPGQIQKENIIATRNWTLQFETGKATFSPSAEQTLRALYDAVVVGGALSIGIDGHTDNVGNPQQNQGLSEARAFAVKDWLERRAPALFPANRINARGFGDQHPVAPNTSSEGRAQNRRVTIILGTK